MEFDYDYDYILWCLLSTVNGTVLLSMLYIISIHFIHISMYVCVCLKTQIVLFVLLYVFVLKCLGTTQQKNIFMAKVFLFLAFFFYFFIL